MINVSKSASEDQNGPAVILSTVHGAKPALALLNRVPYGKFNRAGATTPFSDPALSLISNLSGFCNGRRFPGLSQGPTWRDQTDFECRTSAIAIGLASAIDEGYPGLGQGAGSTTGVYIDSDIAASLSRPEVLLADAFGDEVNIAYVGFTRAIRELHLPPTTLANKANPLFSFILDLLPGASTLAP